MRQRSLQHGAQPPKLGHRIVHLEESQDGLMRATHHEAVARASCGATERGGWRRSSTVLVANIDGRGRYYSTEDARGASIFLRHSPVIRSANAALKCTSS